MQPGGVGRADPPDRDLLRAVAARDSYALGRLFDRYGSAVLALCLRILRNRQDAEEILVDVFWELWERPERFDASRGNLITYLVTLARSRAIDRLRSRKRAREQPIVGDDAWAEPAAAPRAAAWPLENALLVEQRDHIRRALAVLQPDQRRAIELAFYSGLSHSEIASELAQPLGTVKSRIRSGLIQLRDSLRIGYGGGETA